MALDPWLLCYSWTYLLILLSPALSPFVVETHSSGSFQPVTWDEISSCLFSALETLKLDKVYFPGSEDFDSPVRPSDMKSWLLFIYLSKLTLCPSLPSSVFQEPDLFMDYTTQAPLPSGFHLDSAGPEISRQEIRKYGILFSLLLFAWFGQWSFSFTYSHSYFN